MSVAEVIVDEAGEPLRVVPMRIERIPVDDPNVLLLTAPEPPEPLAVVVERHIQAALAYCGGNKSKTARLLGIDRRTLYRRLEKGIEECPSPKSQPLPRSLQRQQSLGRARSRTRP